MKRRRGGGGGEEHIGWMGLITWSDRSPISVVTDRWAYRFNYFFEI
jgi:hypothetical protein